MKKIVALLLTVTTLLCLAACTPAQPSGTTEPKGNPGTTTQPGGETTPSTTAPTQEPDGYGFLAGDTLLKPGEAFDASKLPTPESTSQIPSCAFDGTDNVYNYGSYEVTAYDEGSGEFIYSVYLIDPNVTTPEGLAMGDPASRVTELYGEPTQINGTEQLYISGKTALSVIVSGDAVISIEYRLAQ